MGSGRTKGHKSDQSPGPAAYGLNPMLGIHVLTKGSAPAYSMTARATVGSFHEDLRKTPGPGTYKPVDPSLIKSRGPSYSMIGRNLMPMDSTRSRVLVLTHRRVSASTRNLTRPSVLVSLTLTTAHHSFCWWILAGELFLLTTRRISISNDKWKLCKMLKFKVLIKFYFSE